MFSIDEKFMEEIGILTMPQEARDNLVAGIEETMKNRVLIAIADDLTDFLQTELENISESSEFARDWLSKNIPHYASSKEFEQFRENAKPTEGMTVEQLYTFSKWFEMNIPTFGSTLETVKEQMKQELKLVGGVS